MNGIDMVKKDVELWGTTGLTRILLGNGDVIIHTFEPNETDTKNYSGILFKNIDQKLPVGTVFDMRGKSFKQIQPDAVMLFTDLKSVEVMEHYLQEVKAILKRRQK